MTLTISFTERANQMKVALDLVYANISFSFENSTIVIANIKGHGGLDKIEDLLLTWFDDEKLSDTILANLTVHQKADIIF